MLRIKRISNSIIIRQRQRILVTWKSCWLVASVAGIEETKTEYIEINYMVFIRVFILR